MWVVIVRSPKGKKYLKNTKTNIFMVNKDICCIYFQVSIWSKVKVLGKGNQDKIVV